jgi:hypothetical protein
LHIRFLVFGATGRTGSLFAGLMWSTSDHAPHTAVSTCAKSTIDALQLQSGAAAVNGDSSRFDSSKVRFITIGGVLGNGETYKSLNFLEKSIIFISGLLLGKKSRQDHELQLSFLSACRQPFTVLLPLVLTNGPAMSTYMYGDAL